MALVNQTLVSFNVCAALSAVWVARPMRHHTVTHELHWLPIEHLITFKLNCLTFKAIQFNQPTYLSTLIKSSTLTRGNRLSVSSFHPKRCVGFRSFEVASPLKWNRLPSDIRQQSDFKSLKSKLKLTCSDWLTPHLRSFPGANVHFPFCLILSALRGLN